MQFFRFIFLARSWTSDKVELGNHLTDVGKRAEAADKPLTLFIFPEGTLVSTHTRPLSKKYADKLEIVSFRPPLSICLLTLRYGLERLI